MRFYILCIICIICIIILLPVAINNKLFYTLSNTIPTKNINDIKFRTGDVILYRWNYSIATINKNRMYFNELPSITNTFNNFLVSCIYRNTFFHAGVVIVWNNKPYILELTESDTYCNYNKKITHYEPSLSSMDNIFTYRGIVAHFPYIGRDIDKNKINNILNTKHEYLHAWHRDYGVIKNLQYYYKNNMPELESCGTIDKNLTNISCPKYVNCVQYICSLLYKMGIRNIKKCMQITPNNLFEFCINSNKYNNCSFIETPYLLEYI